MSQKQVWAQTNPLLEGRGVEVSKNPQLLTAMDTGDRDVNGEWVSGWADTKILSSQVVCRSPHAL